MFFFLSFSVVFDDLDLPSRLLKKKKPTTTIPPTLSTIAHLDSSSLLSPFVCPHHPFFFFYLDFTRSHFILFWISLGFFPQIEFLVSRFFRCGNAGDSAPKEINLVSHCQMNGNTGLKFQTFLFPFHFPSMSHCLFSL